MQNLRHPLQPPQPRRPLHGFRRRGLPDLVVGGVEETTLKNPIRAITMQKYLKLLPTIALLADVFTGSSHADTHVVQFSKGASSSVQKGMVKGGTDQDFVLKAGAGQTMKVKLNAKGTLVTFNVLNKATNENLFNGKDEGVNQWSGSLPSDGEYIVRVYGVGQGKAASHKTPFSISFGIK